MVIIPLTILWTSINNYYRSTDWNYQLLDLGFMDNTTFRNFCNDDERVMED